MKKIKIIGALSIVGTLGVGAMAASTMLTSCAKTYSIDESSIKVDDASANKAEWLSDSKTLKFNATDATIQLNFNIQQKANPSVKVVGEFIVARGVAYYALEEGTNNPRTFKELLELANDDNGEAIMSETSWVLVGKGESITSGGDVWTYNSLKFYPRNIGKNYWIFAVPNSKFDSASIDTSYLGNKDIKMLHLSVI